MTTKDNRPDQDEVLDPETLQAVAAAVKPRPLRADRRLAVRERLFARLDGPPPAATQTIRAAEMNWTPVLPLIDIKILYRSDVHNTQTALWRLRPGAVMPGHRHAQEEECWMLEGEVRLGDHVLREGDMHIARPGCEHPDFVSEHGALLLVRSEIRERPPAG